MPTVTSEEDGSEVEIVQVEAVAALASVNSLTSELPPGSARYIEEAMSIAAARVMAEGEQDPDKIREAMLEARRGARQALLVQMRGE